MSKKFFHYCYEKLELTEFMSVLDNRLGKKQTQPLTAKKVRRVGPPSQSLPPLNAPPWAVKKNVDKGQFSLFCL